MFANNIQHTTNKIHWKEIRKESWGVAGYHCKVFQGQNLLCSHCKVALHIILGKGHFFFWHPTANECKNQNYKAFLTSKNIRSWPCHSFACQGYNPIAIKIRIKWNQRLKGTFMRILWGYIQGRAYALSCRIHVPRGEGRHLLLVGWSLCFTGKDHTILYIAK